MDDSSKVLHIGVFVDNLNAVIIARRAIDDGLPVKVSFLAGEGSPDHIWISRIVPAETLRTFRVTDPDFIIMDAGIEDLLAATTLPAVLQSGRVTMILAGRVSAALDGWGRRHGISFFPAKLEYRTALEDKVAFHHFLKRYRVPQPEGGAWEAGVIPLPGERWPRVIQDPDSWSGEGTFVAGSAEEAAGLIRGGRLKTGSSYLVREFSDGIPCGISIFIAPDCIALSAIRRQCYLKHGVGVGLFLGVQWIPHAALSEAAVARINQVFLDLGRILHGQRYFGFANIDFLLTSSGEVRVLECNPRFSAATVQILGSPDLLGGIDAAALFVRQLAGGGDYLTDAPCYGLPATSYDGASLILPSSFEPRGRLFEVDRTQPIGLYRWNGRSAEFLGPDINLKTTGREIIFLSSLAVGERIPDNLPIAYVYTNFPVFDGEGRLNNDGTALAESFRVQL